MTKCLRKLKLKNHLRLSIMRSKCNQDCTQKECRSSMSSLGCWAVSTSKRNLLKCSNLRKAKTLQLTLNSSKLSLNQVPQ